MDRSLTAGLRPWRCRIIGKEETAQCLKDSIACVGKLPYPISVITPKNVASDYITLTKAILAEHSPSTAVKSAEGEEASTTEAPAFFVFGELYGSHIAYRMFAQEPELVPSPLY